MINTNIETHRFAGGTEEVTQGPMGIYPKPPITGGLSFVSIAENLIPEDRRVKMKGLDRKGQSFARLFVQPESVTAGILEAFVYPAPHYRLYWDAPRIYQPRDDLRFIQFSERFTDWVDRPVTNQLLDRMKNIVGFDLPIILEALGLDDYNLEDIALGNLENTLQDSYSPDLNALIGNALMEPLRAVKLVNLKI
jgi:hypothetical protein